MFMSHQQAVVEAMPQPEFQSGCQLPADRPNPCAFAWHACSEHAASPQQEAAPRYNLWQIADVLERCDRGYPVVPTIARNLGNVLVNVSDISEARRICIKLREWLYDVVGTDEWLVSHLRGSPCNAPNRSLQSPAAAADAVSEMHRVPNLVLACPSLDPANGSAWPARRFADAGFVCPAASIRCAGATARTCEPARRAHRGSGAPLREAAGAECAGPRQLAEYPRSALSRRRPQPSGDEPASNPSRAAARQAAGTATAPSSESAFPPAARTGSSRCTRSTRRAGS